MLSLQLVSGWECESCEERIRREEGKKGNGSGNMDKKNNIERRYQVRWQRSKERGEGIMAKGVWGELNEIRNGRQH